MSFNPTKGVPPLMVKALDPDRPDLVCHWFLHCHEPAESQVDHPTLGWVDICDNHIAWLLEDTTEDEPGREEAR